MGPWRQTSYQIYIRYGRGGGVLDRRLMHAAPPRRRGLAVWAVLQLRLRGMRVAYRRTLEGVEVPMEGRSLGPRGLAADTGPAGAAGEALQSEPQRPHLERAQGGGPAAATPGGCMADQRDLCGAWRPANRPAPVKPPRPRTAPLLISGGMSTQGTVGLGRKSCLRSSRTPCIPSGQASGPDNRSLHGGDPQHRDEW